MAIRFDGKVAIVTGAGGGLGREYALTLARRGAKVVVNDLGTDKKTNERMADRVVAEIKKEGGVAVADFNNVVDGDKVVKTAVDAFGTVDIIINNAGILRDVGFHRMKDSDFDDVMKVHVWGTKNIVKAAWPIMNEKKYGRIVNVTSSNGIKGERGQVNYAGAKAAIIGMTKSWAKEGKKNNVVANCLAPGAGSAMTATIMPENMVNAWKAEYVSPIAALLVHEKVPCTGRVFEAGGGWFGETRWQRANGLFLDIDKPITVEDLAAKWQSVINFDGADDIDNEKQPGPMIQQILAKL